MSAYGQYDDLLNTVVGGQISYRFAPAGSFVNDPNMAPKGATSPLPWQAKTNQFRTGQPIQLALGKASHAPITSDVSQGLISQEANGAITLKAGEEGLFSANGTLLSRSAMSQARYSQLVQQTMGGQNLLPESNLISQTYTNLYGTPSPQVLGILGSDWRIAARTPFPRLRGSDNLVVPDDKLPQEELTFVCYSNLSGGYYGPGGYEAQLEGASRFTAGSKKEAKKICNNKLIYGDYPTKPVIIKRRIKSA